MPVIGFAFALLLAGAALALLLMPPSVRTRVGARLRRPPALAAMAVVLALVGVVAIDRDRGPTQRPNVILIMVEGLDVATFEHLAGVERPLGAPPSLTTTLGSAGATFSNAFAVGPQRSAARASLLRGQYAHNHGIWQDQPPDGGYAEFQASLEASTLGVWLQEAGYRTGLIGNYMTGYGDDVLPPLEDRPPLAVPPGWDDSSWRALWGTPSYVKFRMNEGGRLIGRSDDPSVYQTTVLSRMASNLINLRDERPYFLVLAPTAPADGHAADEEGLLRDGTSDAARPSVEFSDLYAGTDMPIPTNFLETDLGGKPPWLQAAAEDWRSTGSESQLTALAESRYVERMEAMASVERLVDDLVNALGPELEHTYLIFTSTNGHHRGEHSLPPGTGTPYEEDVRVPLLIRGPGISAGSVREELVTSLDLTATILDVADATPPVRQDGRSLLGVLSGEQVVPWRRAFLLEYEAADGGVVPGWRAVRSDTHKYIEWDDGFVELYDVSAGVGETDNLAQDSPELVAELAALLDSLTACADTECVVRRDD